MNHVLILMAGTQKAQGGACVPCLPVVKEPAEGTSASTPSIGMRGVHLSSGNQTILENLWEPCPAGDRRRQGWKRAPQATAIHRMEGETGGEGVELQFLNEYAECPERCLGASVVRAMAIWGEYAVDSNWGACRGSYTPTHTPQTLTPQGL